MAIRLILCDIGNTSVKFGLIGESDDKKIEASFAFPVNNEETSDSLGLIILLAVNNTLFKGKRFQACVVSSVVPRLDNLIQAAMERYFNCPTLFAGTDLSIPLKIEYGHPEQIGGDILVGAYEARKLFPEVPSLIVADYGTASTFASVTGNSFRGGVIFPGPGTAMQTLASKTAQLPQVELDYPGEKLIADKDTSTSIQHGIMFGYSALTRGLCENLSADLPKPVKYIATGGFAGIINRMNKIFDIVKPSLVLDGLARLYAENHPEQFQ